MGGKIICRILMAGRRESEAGRGESGGHSLTANQSMDQSQSDSYSSCTNIIYSKINVTTDQVNNHAYIQPSRFFNEWF